jgi:hypothetical protein
VGTLSPHVDNTNKSQGEPWTESREMVDRSGMWKAEMMTPSQLYETRSEVLGLRLTNSIVSRQMWLENRFRLIK